MASDIVLVAFLVGVLIALFLAIHGGSSHMSAAIKGH
jgi:hypothetical protein